jgi:hypothetical protein
VSLELGIFFAKLFIVPVSSALRRHNGFTLLDLATIGYCRAGAGRNFMESSFSASLRK